MYGTASKYAIEIFFCPISIMIFADIRDILMNIWEIINAFQEEEVAKIIRGYEKGNEIDDKFCNDFLKVTTISIRKKVVYQANRKMFK